MSMDQYYKVKSQAPAYCAIADDGSSFKCCDCETEGHASLFWYVATPDGKVRVVHKECVDADWLANAQLVSGEI